MSAAWTIRDSSGYLLPEYVAGSPMDVGRKVVPGRYDPFRLQVSSSYREMFERALRQVLEREHWQIVRMPARARRATCADTPVAAIA